MINIDKEARRIAKEEGLDPDVVKQIIMYQFDFIC